MAESCMKCDHFTPIKLKKDLYAIYCEKHLLPDKVEGKEDLAIKAMYCKAYTGKRKPRTLDKNVWD